MDLGTYLFSFGRNEGCAGVITSCCGEVGQRTKVIALRVIPGEESAGLLFGIYSPVNMPVLATATLASQHEKIAFIENGAGSLSTILKVKQGTNTCGDYTIHDMYLRYIKVTTVTI